MNSKDLDELNKEKINLEIKSLKTPILKNIEFYKILIPTIAILASLYFTFGRGVLDVQKERLELKKERIQFQIEQFEIQKTSIQDSLTHKLKKLASLNLKLINLKSNYDSLYEEVLLSQKELSYKREEVNRYKNKLNDLKSKFDKENTLHNQKKKFYRDLLKNQFQNEKKHFTKISKLNEQIEELEKDILILSTEKEFYIKTFDLSDSDKYDLDRAIYEINQNFYSEKIEKTSHDIERLKRNKDSLESQIDTMTFDELLNWFEIMELKGDFEFSNSDNL